MANRKAVKYFIFYPGRFKSDPMFIFSDSNSIRDGSLVLVDVALKTPHILARVTRREIVEILKNYLWEKSKRYFFANKFPKEYCYELDSWCENFKAFL